MIQGLYFFFKPGEASKEAIPFKRGDTVKILWEGDPSEVGPQDNKYVMFLASKEEGATLAGGPLDQLLTDLWGDFVEFNSAIERATRNQTIQYLADAGLLEPDIAQALIACPPMTFHETLAALRKPVQVQEEEIGTRPRLFKGYGRD